MNNLPYRFTIILSVILVSCYLLYPTYQYYSIDKNELDLYSADEQKELKTKALSLGLDLQGFYKSGAYDTPAGGYTLEEAEGISFMVLTFIVTFSPIFPSPLVLAD